MNKKSVFISIIIILFMVFSLGVGYFLGNKETVSEVEVKKDNEKKLTDEEIDELGKQLFDKTKSNYALYNYYFYDNGKLTVDNMNLEDRLFVTMNNIKFNSIYYNYVKDLTSSECVKASEDDYVYSCYVYKIDKNVFAEAYYNLFNKELSSFSSFIYLDSQDFRECKLEGEEIKCYPRDGGDMILPPFRFINYDKTEYENNVIYVYSDFLAVDVDNSNVGIYIMFSDYEFTKNIGNISEEELYNYYDNNNYEKLFTKFADKTGKYKLTFKQNELGNWYWLQTEVIK